MKGILSHKILGSLIFMGFITSCGTAPHNLYNAKIYTEYDNILLLDTTTHTVWDTDIHKVVYYIKNVLPNIVSCNLSVKITVKTPSGNNIVDFQQIRPNDFIYPSQYSTFTFNFDEKYRKMKEVIGQELLLANSSSELSLSNCKVIEPSPSPAPIPVPSVSPAPSPLPSPTKKPTSSPIPTKSPVPIPTATAVPTFSPTPKPTQGSGEPPTYPTRIPTPPDLRATPWTFPPPPEVSNPTSWRAYCVTFLTTKWSGPSFIAMNIVSTKTTHAELLGESLQKYKIPLSSDDPSIGELKRYTDTCEQITLRCDNSFVPTEGLVSYTVNGYKHEVLTGNNTCDFYENVMRKAGSTGMARGFQYKEIDLAKIIR